MSTQQVIKAAVKRHMLIAEHHARRADLHDIVIAPTCGTKASQRVKLRQVQAELISCGVEGVTLTTISTPDHPRFGYPLLEVEGVFQ